MYEFMHTRNLMAKLEESSALDIAADAWLHQLVRAASICSSNEEQYLHAAGWPDAP
jgi:hypothetical protein